jgi:hypothetical protein
MALLHVYDDTDPNIVGTATARAVSGARMLLAVSDRDALLSSLDSLVQRGQTYNRILVETHGSPGRIWFGTQRVDADWVNQHMAGRGYEALCPTRTRIYFNGCNVAANSNGTCSSNSCATGGRPSSGSRFLQAIASVFLLSAGGSVSAHDSLGFELPYWSWLTGHVVHFFGEQRILYVAEGARVLEEVTASDIR